MSIKIMSLVWEKSQHKGSALLLMLALADHADDKGRCWPGMTSLASKTRMGRRNVIKLMERIEQSGEVVVEQRGGQAVSNRYRINLELLGSERAITSEQAITTPSERAITRVVNRRSHESSLTVNKSSKRGKPRKRNEMFDVLVEVTNSDPKAAGGYIGKTAVDLAQYSPSDVRKWYGANGWWYTTHCRDMNPKPTPSLSGICKTIKQAADSGKPAVIEVR